MLAIKINNLIKKFDDNTVLKDISLEVENGKIVSIIGPSGSGKSTLLRCIANLEKITAGDIEIYGHPLVIKGKYVSHKKQRELTNDMNMVFQSFNLFPHYSALDNIVRPQMLVEGKTRENAVEVAVKLLERVNLYHRKDAYPSQLSGGESQRVAIARSLARSPKMILFDEPTSALDPEMVTEVLEVIRGLKDEGMTLVIVTHEMNFAREISDRVIFMADGKIVEDGTPQELFENTKNKRAADFIKKIL
ncbi:polar amino acid transport system ATP-binding protein [Dethiosulfatibacter aminovorans DSM 17477]|uniref:Polar amino acid transport system ATP-binding protein n=1 Tax=Dethiosulfatibacter aminovorans DSM 17477 TaxID=1121476 RepID=A0A1M6LN92_9FIRM|nr:amino acid ABC transporter ATP-binding protein [Dethiosulfatibacter aminovorans]SHJ72625.1 polar amino acid transport system ATP-binding protein [Dethiosulfatibacter aminovorans DSM 17477]